MIALSSLLVLTSLCAPKEVETIAWRSDLDAAFAEAKSAGRPVFVAINMDGERANDTAVNELYRDERIRELAAATVPLFASRFDHGSGEAPCPRAGVVPCAAHLAIEKAVRQRYLQEQGSAVIAPQHLLIDPEGKVILSVAYQIREAELEWCLLTAIRRLAPDFAWELSAKARAPKRLVMDGVPAGGPTSQTPPPTKKEVEEILALLQKDNKPWQHREEIATLMRSPEKKAIEYVGNLLDAPFMSGGGGKFANKFGGGGGGGEGGGFDRSRLKPEMIHRIGVLSPPEWWPLVAEHLDDAELEVRREAAVALEQLGDPKAISALQKQFKKEKEADAQREQIRALATLGRDDAKVATLVATTARRAKEEPLRVNAVLAAAALEDGALVRELVGEALLAEEPALRAIAAYTAAVRRDPELRTAVDLARGAERDPAVRDALDRALRVLDGGQGSELDPIPRDFAGSQIARDRE